MGCQKLPHQFEGCQQDPIIEDGPPIDPIDLFMLIFSLLHFDLNLFKALIRLSCLVHMNLMSGGISPYIKDVYRNFYDWKYDQIVAAYLNRVGHPRIIIGKVRQGGFGTTDTGTVWTVNKVLGNQKLVLGK